MFTQNNGNAVGTLPLHLRNKNNVVTISIMEEALLRNRALQLLVFPLIAAMKSAINSVPRGEIELIFKSACTAGLAKPEVMVKNSIGIAMVAETIAIYSTKANQQEHARILELNANAQAASIPFAERTVSDLISDRITIDKYIANTETFSQDEKVDSSKGPVAACLAYAGIGKIRNIIEVMEVADHMRSLMSWVDDGLSDEEKCRGITALAIYLSALGEYDSGLFTSKVSLNPQGLYNAKMLGMIDYSHMLSAVALSHDIMDIALQQKRIDTMSFLIKSKSPWRWSAAVDDIATRNSAALASLVNKHPLLPYKPLVTALGNIITAAGADFWAPRELIYPSFSASLFTDLASIPVTPGESSLYLPGEQASILTEEQKTLWMTTLHSLIQKQHEKIMALDSTISAIQIADYIKPRLHVEYKVATVPELLRPRLATCSDSTPVSIGLRQLDHSRTRVLSKYINGVMSYRDVHDRLTEQFPVSARFNPVDYSAFLNVNKALITLPIPDVYLRGESYSTIYLDENNMTTIMHKQGAVDNLTYTKTVELLMFSMDTKYHGYYAYLLSGAFLVVMKESKWKDMNSRAAVWNDLIPGYVVIKPTAAPISSVFNKSIEKLNNVKDINVPFSYGIRAEDLIEVNKKVWLNILKADSDKLEFDVIMRRFLWADGDFNFGLLPLAVIPAPRQTAIDYTIVDGQNALRVNRFKTYDLSTLKFVEGFRWTDVTATTPHLITSFIKTEMIKPLLSRIAIAGDEAVAYVGDYITRPDPEDLLHSPEPWRGQVAPSTPTPPPVDLTAIKPLETPVTNELPPAPKPPKSVEQATPTPSLIPTTEVTVDAQPVDINPPAPEAAGDAIAEPLTEEDKKKKKEKKESESDSPIN